MEESETEDPLHGVLEGDVNISSRPRLRAQTNTEKSGWGRCGVGASPKPTHVAHTCTCVFQTSDRSSLTILHTTSSSCLPLKTSATFCSLALFCVSRSTNKETLELFNAVVAVVKTAPTETKALLRLESIKIETRPRFYISKKNNNQLKKKMGIFFKCNFASARSPFNKFLRHFAYLPAILNCLYIYMHMYVGV